MPKTLDYVTTTLYLWEIIASRLSLGGTKRAKFRNNRGNLENGLSRREASLTKPILRNAKTESGGSPQPNRDTLARLAKISDWVIDSIRILFQKRNRGDFLTNTSSPLLRIVYRPRVSRYAVIIHRWLTVPRVLASRGGIGVPDGFPSMHLHTYPLTSSRSYRGHPVSSTCWYFTVNRCFRTVVPGSDCSQTPATGKSRMIREMPTVRFFLFPERPLSLSLLQTLLALTNCQRLLLKLDISYLSYLLF